MEKQFETFEQRDVTFCEDELLAIRAMDGPQLFESDHYERR